SRSGNPNRQALERAIAALEQGTEAVALASGSAATLAVFQALKTGDHVIAPQSVYFGVQEMLRRICAPWGLAFTLVDTTDVAAVKAAIKPETRLILIETPSNPLLAVTDIQAVAELAHSADAYLACDNTLASPVLQNPLNHGADLVIHATTKYLAGHSDVIGGIVVAREATPLFQQIRLIQEIGGAVPAPFDCYMALRGLQTLPYRVKAQADHAQKLAEFLGEHPAVENVLYPGLPEHPGHAIAAQQMSGYGGVLSILVRGGQAEAMAVAAEVKLFTRATSFGGPHSLIEHRASIEAPGTLTPPNLLRLSVGLEHPADLIADLDQALAAVKG
ncbi:MAG TPA: aminotransferase class I/II-fold pyridoxal phosphate-dependent enzyme, partial [Trichocoleus sp.]